MKPSQFILKNNEKTQAYEKKMEIDIERINTFEKGNKVYTT